MKYWLTVATIAAARVATTTGESCTPGAYRCSSPSGQGTSFLQCDAGGNEIQQSCAPGTVCFSQGSTILCSYPVNTANQPPPASGSLVAGAQCNFVSPFDEYMCPGANGQHDYFLRCLSGTFVNFACPPGTACFKNDGQNMYCGMRGQEYAGSAPPPSSDTYSPVVDESGSTSNDSTIINAGGSASESLPSIDIGGSTSESLPDIDIGGSTSEGLPDIDIGGSTSESLPAIDIGGSRTDLSLDIAIGAETSESLVIIDVGASVDESESDTHDIFDTISPLYPTTSSDADISVDASADMTVSSGMFSSLSSTDNASDSTSKEDSIEPSPSNEETPRPTATSHGSGLTGPVISSGLEMLLQNDVHLPFTLPNIDLPAIDLGTVHLPDMTFDGIAITGIPLPSITLPPMNPASLTNFKYIEEIMSKAGVTFDDLAKLPLPDLNKLDLSDLDHLDVASVMSVMNVNRISAPDGMSAMNIAEELPPFTETPHTTTLDADGIDALLGLSVITYSSA
ncbi:hypothetical protein IWW55_000512 [Coemansia sp. RSA 2706]|nr:hypothetical protein IWW55_000512 [Coemansia sp. RSA 2706]